MGSYNTFSVHKLIQYWFSIWSILKFLKTSAVPSETSMFDVKALPLETDFDAHNFDPHWKSEFTPRTDSFHFASSKLCRWKTDFNTRNFNPLPRWLSLTIYPPYRFLSLNGTTVLRCCYLLYHMLNIPFSHYFQFTPDSDFSGLNKFWFKDPTWVCSFPQSWLIISVKTLHRWSEKSA